MLGLDLAAWVLPVFCVPLLELECKHPVESGAFCTYACLLCYGWAGVLAVFLLPPTKQAVGTEECHGEQPTGSE